MAETSWPSAGPATITEHDHERLWSARYQSGLVGDPSLSSLIFADSTGLQVKARANRLAQVRGFEWSSGTTDVAVPITENASGSTRQDRVVLQLDRSTWQVRLTTVDGTPGAGRPSLTQDPGPDGVWQILVANVTVADGATGIDAADVDPRSTYLGAGLLVADNGDLPDGGPLPRQFFRYMPDDDRLQFHTDGESLAGRRTLWQDSGEVDITTSNAAWESVNESVIRKINNVVHLSYSTVQKIGGPSPENSDSPLPGLIPSFMRPTHNQSTPVRLSGHAAGRVVILRANDPTAPGRIRLLDHPEVTPGQFMMGFTLTWLVP